MEDNHNKKTFEELSSTISDLSSLVDIDFNKDINENISQLKKRTEQLNNSLIKNGKFQDDYTDFTEFEDENGIIQLIKYSVREFDFRGNKYCKYILCNEKTGSREEGIAQVKGGQHIHVKDEERKQKIREYIDYTIKERLEKCIKLKSHDNHNNLIYIGYLIEEYFKDPLYVFYQIGDSKYFYSLRLCDMSGEVVSFEVISYLIDYCDRFIKNKNYHFPDKDSIYDLLYEINGENKKLVKISSVKRTISSVDEDGEKLNETTIYSLYRIIGTDDYVVLTKDIDEDDEDLLIEDDIEYIESAFDLNKLMPNGHLITHHNNHYASSKQVLKKEKIILTILLLPFFVLLLYPITELILWTVAHIFPIFWANKFSATGVTEFATKYLPYAYHPSFNWFSHFSVNALSIGIFYYILSIYNDTQNKVFLYIGMILSVGFIYTMFVPNAFNIIGTFSAWVVGIAIILTIIKCFKQ